MAPKKKDENQAPAATGTPEPATKQGTQASEEGTQKILLAIAASERKIGERIGERISIALQPVHTRNDNLETEITHTRDDVGKVRKEVAKVDSDNARQDVEIADLDRKVRGLEDKLSATPTPPTLQPSATVTTAEPAAMNGGKKPRAPRKTTKQQVDEAVAQALAAANVPPAPVPPAPAAQPAATTTTVAATGANPAGGNVPPANTTTVSTTTAADKRRKLPAKWPLWLAIILAILLGVAYLGYWYSSKRNPVVQPAATNTLMTDTPSRENVLRLIETEETVPPGTFILNAKPWKPEKAPAVAPPVVAPAPVQQPTHTRHEEYHRYDHKYDVNINVNHTYSAPPPAPAPQVVYVPMPPQQKAAVAREVYYQGAPTTYRPTPPANCSPQERMISERTYVRTQR